MHASSSKFSYTTIYFNNPASTFNITIFINLLPRRPSPKSHLPPDQVSRSPQEFMHFIYVCMHVCMQPSIDPRPTYPSIHHKSQGRPSPEAMMHFSPLFQMSPYFRKLFRRHGKFFEFHLFPKIFLDFHLPKFLMILFSH